MSRMLLIATGGTGGHVLPALSLAAHCVEQGVQILFATDSRGERFMRPLRGCRLFSLPQASPLAQRGLGRLRALAGLRKYSKLLYRDYSPDAVLGFGGYASAAALWGARLRGVPYGLHEQNAVCGRVNRLFARRATCITLGYAKTQNLPSFVRAVHTGNPLRSGFLPATVEQGKKRASPTEKEGTRLLVAGGSQGARWFETELAQIFCSLPAGLRASLRVVQQAAPERQKDLGVVYTEAGIKHRLHSFIEDMYGELRAADLVISRAGASSVGEIAHMGIPAIFMPYAAATDAHQLHNALPLAEEGQAIIMAAGENSAVGLGEVLVDLLGDPVLLGRMRREQKPLAELAEARIFKAMRAAFGWHTA